MLYCLFLIFDVLLMFVTDFDVFLMYGYGVW